MFQPFLLPKQTRIIRDALTQMQPRDGDEVELARLVEWFEAEVKANAQARGDVTGV